MARLTLNHVLRHLYRKKESAILGWFRVAFAPDGRALLTAVDGAVCRWDWANGTIALCEAATGRELHRLRGYPPRVAYVLHLPRVESYIECDFHPFFSPDGKTLAAGGEEDTVRLWDVATGKELPHRPAGRQFVLGAMAFSPDGRLLAVLAGDGVPSLLEVGTGRVRRLSGKEDRDFFAAPAFSPDGKLLATPRADGAVRVWEVLTGQELCLLRGHRGHVRRILFSPEGRSLATVGGDSTALVWGLADLFLGHRPRTGDLSGKDLEDLWADLAGADAARARRAIQRLAAGADRSVPFLRDRLEPVPPVDPKRLDRLIADLDSDDFAVRERATGELERLAAGVGPSVLRRVLAGKPPPEARRRIENLLAKWETAAGPPPNLRALRAIEVLERVGTPGARRVLDRLAEGEAGARITEEARASRERLTRRARPGAR
jgi:hypothetical protein